MSHRSIPAELLPWALSSLGQSSAGRQPDLTVVAGDASSRRYFRLRLPGHSYIVVHAPPATEKNDAFLAVRELLQRAGVKVPALHAVDLARGFLLLEDLGDQLLLAALDAHTVDHHYHRAFDLLRRVAELEVSDLDLPAYDRDLLEEELSRFCQWFVQGLLGYEPGADERQLMQTLYARLVDSALEQPKVLVHRDFHSRNLMLQPGESLAVIDFQDAVCGPVSYDLVSLLRDCYIRWPRDRVRSWALAHRDALCDAGLLPAVPDDRFLRWFDWMGLQRHIKVLGTFARLYLRDGKAAYLDDLPLVIDYVREVLGEYALQEPAFAAFLDWFEQRLSPLVEAQGWSAAS